MRILKIVDAFITNSSSDFMVIVVAIRKTKDLLLELENVCTKLGISNKYIPEFDEGLESFYGEVDHLIDEYDFYFSEPTTYSWGDEYYNMPGAEFREIVKLFEHIKKRDKDDDLLVLRFDKSVV